MAISSVADQAPGKAVTIYIAPRSQRPVLAALTDLSAAGLLSPFHWIESGPDPSADPAQQDPLTLAVNQGQVSALRFSRAVNRHAVEVVRLIVVVPVGHEARDALSALAELHFQGLGIPGQARRECVRVLVPWSDAPIPGELGHQGWHNVMLSPEVSADPAFTVSGWWLTPEAIPGCAAVGLAVQGGITGTVSAAPEDDQRPSTSDYVKITRTFVRVADARAVEDALRSQVTSIAAHYPQPIRSDTGVPVAGFPDPGERVVQAAADWERRHGKHLRRPPARLADASPPRSMGAWKLLKMFFAFLLKALAGAPGDWLRKQIAGIKAGIAGSVSAAVFGPDSPVRVVVGGVDASGQPASWQELSRLAAQASASIPEEFPRAPQPAARDFGGLWQDLISGSRALLDGSGCEELRLTAYEGYVPERDLVAPSGEDEGSLRLPQAIDPLPADTVLHAWDELETQRVRRVLQKAAAENGPRAATAQEYLRRIESWHTRNSRRFVPLIGRAIARHWEAARADIRDTQARLDELRAQDFGQEIEHEQRSLAKILRLLLLVLGIAVGVPLVLTVLGRMSWFALGITVGGALLIWLLASVWIFAVRQREVFRLIFLTESRSAQLPELEANLRMAIEDLSAIGEAYAQFNRWAAIITEFLADPLGEQQATAPTHDSRGVPPEPLQHVTVEVDQRHAADVAAELRRQVFTVGWLSEAWDAFEAAVADDLTPEQRSAYNAGHLNLLNEPGHAGSALANWEQGVLHAGVRSSAGLDKWRTCLGLLADSTGPRLDLAVITSDGERRAVAAYREDLSTPASRPVISQVLSPAAHATGRALTSLANHWFTESTRGLSQTMVLAASTDPIPSGEFVFPQATDSGNSFRLDEPVYDRADRSAATGRTAAAAHADFAAADSGGPDDAPPAIPQPPFGPLEY
ncbi:hypothetical protein GZ998_03440 [Actinomyces sp. 594]|uniref:hypothetical protein n=1 Tax=Actinomyces sp. 594 TaxID=2057793 RepID=UPI001C589A25|nr:hypothetical protein [Actinomyces sp. 594]MBW3068567.1 hypothetical protein [Actinomyces sp. 594]